MLLIMQVVLATGNGHPDSSHDGVVLFPAWTYYVEIVEHVLMAVIAFYVLVQLFEGGKQVKVVKAGLAGFALFLIAEILTILHHFMIYTFGIYTAIVHHGLLLISAGLIAYAFIESAKK